MRTKSSGSLITVVSVVCLIVAAYLLGVMVATPQKIRYEKAFVESREYVGDQWNVTFVALDGNRYLVEDFAVNEGATSYKLKFATNDTTEFFDDTIIEITQVTDLTK